MIVAMGFMSPCTRFDGNTMSVEGAKPCPHFNTAPEITSFGMVASLHGTIIVRAKTKSVRELAGIVKLPKGKRVAIEDMNPWRR